MKKSIKYKLKCKRKIWVRRGLISGVIAIVLYIFSFVCFNEVDYVTSEKHNVTIYNVQFDNLPRGPYWVTFSTQIGECFAIMPNPAKDRDTIRQLSDSRKNVSIVVTYANQLINQILYSGGRTQVIDIRDDEQTYININDYNKQLFSLKITCIAFATLVFIVYNGVTILSIWRIIKGF